MLGRASSAGRSSSPGQGERLAERRRGRRRKARIALCVLSLLVIGTLIWGLWQSAVRISQVEIFGPTTDQRAVVADIATRAMLGNYLGIVPRDSILFFPEERMRVDILSVDSAIAAVSILRSSLTSISIKVDYRVPIARWCGSTDSGQASSSQVVLSDENCYVFDSSGVIYAVAATTTETINTFMLYAPLDSPRQSSEQATRDEPPVVSVVEPLRAHIKGAEKLSATFDFARRLATFGSPVASIAISGDEVNHTLVSGTRVTYVLGNEQNAFTALVSSRENINFTDGSVDYVDLRFDGKVYLKKKE